MATITEKMKYRPDIDGLRAVAVLPVVLYHLDLGWVPGGYVGVDIFFVISGYLITCIINSEIKLGTFTIAGFYERRVRRIFPALYAMLAVVVAAAWYMLLPSDYALTLRGAIATVAFSSNILFAKSRVAGYFAPNADHNPLLHTWSLAVEEQFYLLFPLFLILCYRFFPKHVRLVCAVAAVLSLLSAIGFMRISNTAVFYLSPFRAWELLVGCLLALDAVKPMAQQWQRELVGGLGLSAIGYSLFCYSDTTLFPGIAALPPVLGAAALIHSGGNGDSMTSRFLRLPVLVFVGAISYSLYLWHWPIIVLVRFWTNFQPFGWHAALLFIASIALAIASYYLVERPFRSRQIGRTRKGLFAGAATAMSAILVAGALGWLANRWHDHFDPYTIKLDEMRLSLAPFKEKCELSSTICVIGDTDSGPPHILIWGDSHALVWGPVFDFVLKKSRAAALFAPRNGCPALLGVHESSDPNCYAHNVAIRDLIDRTPTLKAVIVITRWNRYFTASQNRLTDYKGHGAGNARIAIQALSETLNYLKKRGVTTLLLSDVPQERSDVPLSMALTRAFGITPMLPVTVEEVRADQALFLSAARSEESAGSARLIDVSKWFCDNRTCPYQDGDTPLYRDENHLSVAGAMSRAPQISSMLESADLIRYSDHVAPSGKQAGTH